MKRSLLALCLAAGAFLLWSGSAGALSYTFTLEHGSEGGFGFSSIHEATGCSAMCGPQVTELSGSFVLDYNAGAFSVVSSSITGTGGYTLELLGGTLFEGGTNVANGTLDYQLTGPGTSHSGTFAFAPLAVGPANSVGTTELRLWGWNEDSQTPLGIDLGASAAATPEPTAALVFGIGLLLVQARTRRP